MVLLLLLLLLLQPDVLLCARSASPPASPSQLCAGLHCVAGHGDPVYNAESGACSCMCTSRYSGEACDSCAVGRSGYPECVTASCGGVTCGRHGAGYWAGGGCSCRCDPGWSGPECSVSREVDGSFCRGVTCSGRGTPVINTAASGCSCRCDPGYTGISCERAVATPLVPRCSGWDCRNRGVPSDTLSGCSCICSQGYSGRNCQVCSRGYVGYPTCRPEGSGGGRWTAAVPPPLSAGPCSSQAGEYAASTTESLQDVSSPSSCCSRCTAVPTSRCVFWSFHAGRRQCDFKLSGGTLRNSADFVSGTRAATTTSLTGGDDADDDDDDDLPLILGIVFGSVVALCILCCLLWWLCFGSKGDETRKEAGLPAPPPPPPPPRAGTSGAQYGERFFSASPRSKPLCSSVPSAVSSSPEVYLYEEPNPIASHFPNRANRYPSLSRETVEFNDSIHKRDGTYA